MSEFLETQQQMKEQTHDKLSFSKPQNQSFGV